MNRWIWLLSLLLLCLGVGAVSGAMTAREVQGWYQTLTRPSFAPPNWVFAPVWTTLYILMAAAAWLVALTPASNSRTLALSIFFAQLLLNFLWSLIFFREHAIGLAMVELILLWCCIALTAIVFHRFSHPAAWLMLPYLAWVTFAGFLNWGFLRLNRM